MNKEANKNKIPEEAIKLLPWYATGWLSPEERAYVKKVLSQSTALQKELNEEHEMIKIIHEDKSLLDASAILPTEQRLENVFAKIDELEKAELQKNKGVIDVSTPASKLRQLVSSFLTGNQPKAQYAAFAMVSVLAIVIVFSLVSPLFVQKNVFYPATVDTQESTKQKNVTILLVGLSTNPQNPQIKKLLQENHASINAVPGKDGMYRIILPTKLDQKQTSQLVNQFLSRKNLFWFVGEAY